MLIFTLKAHGRAGAGGMAVVAAPTTMRACELATEIDDPTWLVDYAHPHEINILPLEHLAEGVLEHYEFGPTPVHNPKDRT